MCVCLCVCVCVCVCACVFERERERERNRTFDKKNSFIPVIMFCIPSFILFQHKFILFILCRFPMFQLFFIIIMR